MPIDPAIAAVYARNRARGLAIPKNPAEERAYALELSQELFAEYAVPVRPVPTVDVTVPVDGAPDVRLRLFRPEIGGPLPAYVAFFGGSFRLGGVEWPAPAAAFSFRSIRSQAVTVAVDYALAPEHPYPAAVFQGMAALEWVVREGGKHGIDPARIAIGGMSSGANLAAAVALLNRDTARIPLQLQLLEVPALDLTGRYLSLAAAAGLGRLGFLTLIGLTMVARGYLGGTMTHAHEPYASPLLAPDLSGLPPARILTAQYDPLRRNGEAYAVRLRRAHVDAAVTRFAGMTHDAAAYTRVLPSARMWQDTAVTALSSALHPQ
ncbi:MAG: alpha/beta hydrolase [Bifidobacteriaceae bacterium]|jgi:acetyl esterase|nr:alpha/beta hydrolase [Bifidobacteriaceae bacterium]